jgi:hypothetical protein
MEIKKRLASRDVIAPDKTPMETGGEALPNVLV